VFDEEEVPEGFQITGGAEQSAEPAAPTTAATTATAPAAAAAAVAASNGMDVISDESSKGTKRSRDESSSDSVEAPAKKQAVSTSATATDVADDDIICIDD
jgi:hypothetical protein